MKLRRVMPILIVAMMGFVTSAFAQGQANKLSIAVINEKEVFIRSGNSDGHYPIGKAKQGEIVRVVDEKYEWALIQTVGPVFERFHGLIKYPDRFADRLEVAPDGKSARTTARVDVIAPNPKVKPGESWKMIARLEANQTVTILESGKTARGETLHKIVLPPTARVWIKKQHLRPASPQEKARWTQMLTGVAPEAIKKNTTIAQSTPETIGGPASQSKPAERVLARDTTPVDPITKPEIAPKTTNDAMKDSSVVTSNQPAEIVMQPDPKAKRTPRPAQPTRSTPQSSKAKNRLKELEAMYSRLQNESIDTAEIEPLKQLYLDLAQEFGDHKMVLRYANARAEQLDIWGELQHRRSEMDKIRVRLRLTTEEAEAIHEAMASGKEYVAVGRLSASVIYDGTSLPRLLRLQDPGTGRTIAYLETDLEGLELGGMVDQLIGIVGTREYDGGLRLTLIHPTRVDLLSPQP